MCLNERYRSECPAYHARVVSRATVLPRLCWGGGGYGRVQDDLVLVTKESVVKVARRNSVKADVLAIRLNVNGSL